MGLIAIHENHRFILRASQIMKTYMKICYTPENFTWNLYKNHPFARENHLPNIHYCVIVFKPLISRVYHMFPFTRFNAVSQGTVMDGNHQCSSRYMRSIKPRSRRHWKFESRRKVFCSIGQRVLIYQFEIWNFGKWLHNSARIIWKDVFTGCSCSIKACKLSQVSVIVS